MSEAPETPGIGDLQSVPVRHTADRRDGRNRDIRVRQQMPLVLGFVCVRML